MDETVQGFTHLASDFPKLKSIEISILDISPAELKEIKKINKNVNELSLPNKTLATEGFKELVRIFPNVESIGLQGKEVDENDLSIIVNAYHGLKVASFRGNDKITDQGFCELNKCCKQLQELDISNTGIKGENLEGIEKNLNLKKLLLPDTITDKGLRAISLIYPNIQEIDLDSCDNLTDKGIASVANPNLQSIILSGTKASFSTLKELAEKCPNLMKIEVSEEQFKNRDLQQLMTTFPYLVIRFSNGKALKNGKVIKESDF